MKSLKEFTAKASKEVITEEQIISVEELALELEDAVDLYETKTYKDAPVFPSDPPAMLLMRRTSVRMFPNGQRVALYYIDKINKYVSVPYMPTKWSQDKQASIPHFSEETVEENVLHHLKHIVENHSADTIVFEDGKSRKVDVQTASVILEVYNVLNDANKNKIQDMANKSREHFQKVADFAYSHASNK